MYPTRVRETTPLAIKDQSHPARVPLQQEGSRKLSRGRRSTLPSFILAHAPAQTNFSLRATLERERTREKRERERDWSHQGLGGRFDGDLGNGGARCGHTARWGVEMIYLLENVVARTARL